MEKEEEGRTTTRMRKKSNEARGRKSNMLKALFSPLSVDTYYNVSEDPYECDDGEQWTHFQDVVEHGRRLLRNKTTSEEAKAFLGDLRMAVGTTAAENREVPAIVTTAVENREMPAIEATTVDEHIGMSTAFRKQTRILRELTLDFVFTDLKQRNGGESTEGRKEQPTTRKEQPTHV